MVRMRIAFDDSSKTNLTFSTNHVPNVGQDICAHKAAWRVYVVVWNYEGITENDRWQDARDFAIDVTIGVKPIPGHYQFEVHNL
jgi:hypothetical protein